MSTEQPRGKMRTNLLIYYAPLNIGLPASKQTLSRWILDAINMSYKSSDLPLPMGVKAHSTRSVAASKAFFAGVPLQDICNAAVWSTPLIFVRFYGLDIRAPGLICPLALDVLHRDTHWAGTSKSGSLGISFPERPSTQLKVPEEERLRLRM